MSPIRERIANRKLHREQSPIRGREVAGLLVLVSLIALPIVFGLSQDSESIRTSFAIETLRREKLVLQERYRRLRIERATLESLDRVALEARKLGLVPGEEAPATALALGVEAFPAPAVAAAPTAPSAGPAGTAATRSADTSPAPTLLARKGRP